jgi:hypothetical protein
MTEKGEINKHFTTEVYCIFDAFADARYSIRGLIPQTTSLVFKRYKNRPFRTVQTIRKKDGFYPSN